MDWNFKRGALFYLGFVTLIFFGLNFFVGFFTESVLSLANKTPNNDSFFNLEPKVLSAISISVPVLVFLFNKLKN